MQLPEIERLCHAIVPGSGSVDLTALGAGLISETYRVVRDGVAYSLKVAAEHRPDLRLDLAWEVRVLELAGSVGLAPRLVYFDPDNAVRLTRWAEGRSWVSHEAAAAANLEKIAALLRRVHDLALPMPARRVTPLQWIKIYDDALSRSTAAPSDPVLRSAALGRAEALLELPRVVGAVCHSDLHAMNLIQQDDSLILLDWEYAHVTDPFWDLAGWCGNNDFGVEVQWSLLTHYLGNAPISSQWPRFRLLLALYDYVCLLWSQLYLSVRCAEANGVAERARLLDARLRVAAHYAA
jgi:aminoglycoside phosphotransferase (APT) family kinase protein